MKRSLQKFQGGSKKICGKDSATVFSVLKYLFVNASLKSCETIVKKVINELLHEESITAIHSSLELYRLLVKTKIHQNPEILNTIEFEEGNISTLITEHKPFSTENEWKRICWFGNDFCKDNNFLQHDLSYEDVLHLKYSKFQSLVHVIDCSKKWAEISSEQIRQKTVRYQAAEKDHQVKITSGQIHIVSVLDEEIKALTDFLPTQFNMSSASM